MFFLIKREMSLLLGIEFIESKKSNLIGEENYLKGGNVYLVWMFFNFKR